ncbi:tRNA(Ile)-lysidine synthetase [Chthoniobacter flavus Ellin428]|uniref:tRNA(Ile)-lysidine synthase n=1 Tax=Chthoniobacter flavus Ellin428 TaxID=497964 RepID=B4D0P9_9BACT|nr:tRNA lysidine(34) synthetase TilS [Chthoniobacter flavus]EDY19911.1 tRNA(Ile)-lysidine synthetase [Chthoniobacter flavus Ellin428]TCO91818.1 tRNA(Ile)-lysidine synthetase-like protein [Chthoniobacter flavus]
MNTAFSPEERCLIGVSGGRDSVALLHQLHAAGFRELIVCHLDHALRAESVADAQFVEKLARKLDYAFVLQREDVATLAKQRKKSLETTAREARISFFTHVAREHDCPRLFLAHHADDQVETLLFNLFRGAGAAGLAGMSALSTRTIDGVTLQISRPFLGTWREEIEAYILRHKLSFVEDASNSDRKFTRNRLRHDIIPVLEQAFGRDIRRSIWRSAEILRAEDDLFADLLGNTPPELSVPALAAEPIAIQRRRLRAWLKLHGVADIGFEEVEAVRALLKGGTAKANLPRGWHARRRAKRLFLEPPRNGLSD